MLRVGGEDFAMLGMDGGGDDSMGAAGDARGHHDGFGGAGRAVVHAGVGDVHAGEFADHGLELEDGLQGPLRDFGLIRGVTGEEFAALDQGINDDRAIVTIAACAEKAGVTDCVLCTGLAEVIDDLALGHLARNVEVALQAVFLRNYGKEIVDGACTDLVEHINAFGGRFGKITHIQLLASGS